MNEQQLLMLKLFKKPLPEEDFQQLRRLAVKLLGQQLDKTTEAWENQQQITAEHYETLSKGHFRRSSK